MTDSSLSQTIILVENAGYSRANGEYKFHGTHLNAGVFTRTGRYQSKEVFYSIFRCFSLSNSWWSLVVTAANKWSPDIDSSIEWIYQSRGFSLETPPATQWTTDNAVGGCAPTMKIIRGNQRAFDEEMTPIMSLFQDHDNRDFSISYLSEKFPVHKCWLVSTSLYFKRMFSSEWNDTNMCEVVAFAAFLTYLYLQPKETLIHHGPAIWKLCDYFEVSSYIKK
jgi:hypothetical protein